MKPQTLGLRVAGAIFGVVACVHALRLIINIRVVVGDWDVPLWLNGLAAIVAGGLCIWMWMLARLHPA